VGKKHNGLEEGAMKGYSSTKAQAVRDIRSHKVVLQIKNRERGAGKKSQLRAHREMVTGSQHKKGQVNFPLTKTSKGSMRREM